MEIQTVQDFTKQANNHKQLPSNKSFIEANTKEVTALHLKKDCIIPVFSKDNETTICHQEFIETVYNSIKMAYPMEMITEPEIRVSHEIKGRIPEAIGKPAKDLLENEKTLYYERVAFVFEISSIKNIINGNELKLTVGGVRAYNQENLYSKKSMEKFKVFIGFKNLVCCNLCVSTDGYADEIRASNSDELSNKITPILQQFNIQKALTNIDSFADYELTQHQFCQFIGRARLYNFLPKKIKSQIPLLSLNDGQISTVTKAYYEDENFACSENGNINLWRMYNLFTGSVKSSYIDNYLEKVVNAHQLTNGFISALDGDPNYKWFLD